MSRAIFNAISGGTVTLDAQDTVDNKVLVIPAADGTLLYDDGSGTQTFNNIALTGAVTSGAWHGSTIDVAYGGTGATTLTGLVYGNGTSAMTAATASQIVAAIGSTPVANATSAVTSTNIAGGASGSIPYQTGSGATSLLPKGSDGQYLKLASGLPSWGDITSISTLTGALSSPTSIQFGNGSGTTLAAGKMWYDNTTGSLNFGMGGGNITQQVGEEIFIYGKASAAITEGQLICKTGTVGASGVITFAPSPTGLTTNDGIIGVATENIASGAFGRITTFGVIHGINTTGSSVGETWADNDTLYYNPSYVGGLTKVKPSAPNIKFEVATVINAGSGGSGSIQVLLQPGSTLGGTDSNVQFGTLATNNLIQYNGTYWTNVAASSVSVGSATTATTATNIAGGASGSLPYQTASGTTALLPKGTDGQVLSLVSGLPAWISVSGAGTVTSVSGSGGTTGLTLTGGPITSSGTLTLGGTLVVANGGTGAATLTGYVKGNGTSAMTASTTIPTTDLSGTISNAQLANSAITINGVSTSLGGTINVGTVTSVTGTAPVVSSGGATPAISMAAASTSTDGYLSSTDWNTFNNKQPAGTYVTAVSVASSNGFAGTSSGGATPSLTLTTTISGILKGNATAISAATAGTDYVAPATATNFTAQQYFGNVALTDGATISWAANTAQTATFTFVSNNRTMGAPSGLVNGAFYALAVIQNGGSNTLTWNSVFKWAGGTAPTLSTAAGAKDYFVFRSDGTNLYEQGRSLGVA